MQMCHKQYLGEQICLNTFLSTSVSNEEQWQGVRAGRYVMSAQCQSTQD